MLRLDASRGAGYGGKLLSDIGLASKWGLGGRVDAVVSRGSQRLPEAWILPAFWPDLINAPLLVAAPNQRPLPARTDPNREPACHARRPKIEFFLLDPKSVLRILCQDNLSSLPQFVCLKQAICRGCMNVHNSPKLTRMIFKKGSRRFTQMKRGTRMTGSTGSAGFFDWGGACANPVGVSRPGLGSLSLCGFTEQERPRITLIHTNLLNRGTERQREEGVPADLRRKRRRCTQMKKKSSHRLHRSKEKRVHADLRRKRRGSTQM